MNRINQISIVCLFIAICSYFLMACTAQSKIADKTGAQLWAENCQRCHNIPPPNSFNDMQWNVITTHMASKLAISDVEEEKIVEFLKSGN